VGAQDFSDDASLERTTPIRPCCLQPAPPLQGHGNSHAIEERPPTDRTWLQGGFVDAIGRARRSTTAFTAQAAQIPGPGTGEAEDVHNTLNSASDTRPEACFFLRTR